MGVKVLYDEARGVWYAQPYLGTSPDGRQIRPRRSFPDAATEEQAQELAEAWVRGLNADGQVKSAYIADMLWDYIATRSVKDIAPNTQKRWSLFTRSYVGKYLKNRAARELTPRDMTEFEQRLGVPKERGGQGLCRNSVSSVHNFLRGAFNFWVRVGLVDSNPMLYVSKPREDRHEAVAIDEWDIASVDTALLEAMTPQEADERSMRQAAYAFAAWLSLHTGMRLGEVCACRRRDVVRQMRWVHVCGNVIEVRGGVQYVDMPKGRKSRNIKLTDAEIATIDAFLALQNRVYGRLSPDAALVSAGGGFMRPGTVSIAFSRMRDKLGLPSRCTFHTLRHTHATWCLINGLNLKDLAYRMGHADESITLRTYAHLMPGRDEAAPEIFNRFLAHLKDGGEGSVNGV